MNPSGLEIEDRVVEKGVNRCAKVMKGGRRFSFSALVVSGDRGGVVGYGFGKANDVPSAVEKATKDAHRGLVRVTLEGDTIPHQIVGRFGAARVAIIPASAGTGVIAGPCVRAVLELVGVRNVLTKSYGSNNPINVVKAVMDALMRLRNTQQVAALRGVELGDS